MYLCVCLFQLLYIILSRRLGSLERNNVLYSRSQVISEIRRHYMTEVKEQKRVLIFGGNAVGNPYGLLRGGAEGVKDLFNEPIQVFLTQLCYKLLQADICPD